MVSEGHYFMFGGTKKRSTLVEEKIIYFPREDASAPRQKILREYCPKQLDRFKACLEANNGDENRCLKQKRVLTKCADAAFRKVNNDSAYMF
jgi:hypothetical protein